MRKVVNLSAREEKARFILKLSEKAKWKFHQMKMLLR